MEATEAVTGRRERVRPAALDDFPHLPGAGNDSSDCVGSANNGYPHRLARVQKTVVVVVHVHCPPRQTRLTGILYPVPVEVVELHPLDRVLREITEGQPVDHDLGLAVQQRLRLTLNRHHFLAAFQRECGPARRLRPTYLQLLADCVRARRQAGELVLAVNVRQRVGRDHIALAVGAIQPDRPAPQPRLAVVQPVAVQIVELVAVDRRLQKVAERQAVGQDLDLTGQ